MHEEKVLFRGVEHPCDVECRIKKICWEESDKHARVAGDFTQSSELKGGVSEPRGALGAGGGWSRGLQEERVSNQQRRRSSGVSGFVSIITTTNTELLILSPPFFLILILTPFTIDGILTTTAFHSIQHICRGGAGQGERNEQSERRRKVRR